jgi:putative ABC transport system substrate-binding protein
MPPLLRAFRELGYEEGRNIRIDSRYAKGRKERIPQIAAELVADKVDIILTPNEPALRAAKQATATIPIVFLAWDYDPLAAGLVESLSHPGGNVTGVSLLQTQLMAKRLELLKETLPNARRVIVFWDSFSRRHLEEIQSTARTLNMELYPVEVRNPAAFGDLIREHRHRADAALVLYSAAFFLPRATIAAAALKAGLPTVFQEPWFTTAGGLLSYGPDLGEAMRRVAYLIDRLLKGSAPSALPVEQISKLHLAINLKTAEALRVRIPESVMFRADEVIR